MLYLGLKFKWCIADEYLRSVPTALKTVKRRASVAIIAPEFAVVS